MKINKNTLIKACQDFINSYNGSHGKIDFSKYTDWLKFKFGIDEGYIGKNGDSINIVIQGTDEKLEWRGDKSSNLNIFNKAIFKLKERLQVTSKNHAGDNEKIKVHPGFYEAFLTGKKYFRDVCKGYKYIFVIGHSRGAGIGTLAARDIQYQIDNVWKTDQKVILITGGSPRVYNWYGADEFNKSKVISYRLKYRNDIVSNIPWPIMGYKHIGKKITLGKSYIPSPIGIPWDHRPIKYLEGMKKYKGLII